MKYKMMTMTYIFHTTLLVIELPTDIFLTLSRGNISVLFPNKALNFRRNARGYGKAERCALETTLSIHGSCCSTSPILRKSA